MFQLNCGIKLSLIKLNQYIGNIAKAVIRSHIKTLQSKILKQLVELNEVFIFEK